MLSTYQLVCVALTALLCLWVGARPAQNMFEPLSDPRKEKITIAALLCVGLLLRCAQLWIARGALLPEEIWTGLQADALLRSGRDLMGKPWPVTLAGWLGEPNGPLLSWLAMLPQAVFGRGALALRLPMLLLQTISLWALWDLIRRAYSPRAAFWALLLASLSPWQLLQSRWSIGWELLPYLMLLSVWMFARQRRVTLWLCGGAAVLAMAMYTGDAAWYIVPLFVLIALASLLRLRAARWRSALPALLIFCLLSAPALYTLAAQHFALPERRVLGLQAGQVPGYAHAGDWILSDERPVTSSYASDTMQPQVGFGPQMIPLLQGDWRVASLHTDLFESGYATLKGTVLQYTDDPGYTLGFFLPEQGYLYLCSIPLTLLGFFYLLRASKRRREASVEPPPARRLADALLLAWIFAATPFLLTHLKLTLPHYAALFFPLLLCAACGAAYVAKRARWAALLLLTIYCASLGQFLVQGYNPEPTFPGLTDALAYTKAQDSPRLVITTRLYPHEKPVDVATLATSWVYDLDPAYVRGEAELPGKAPFVERFLPTDFPSFDFEAAGDATLLLHTSEEILLDTSLYRLSYFGEYVVAEPIAEAAAE